MNRRGILLSSIGFLLVMGVLACALPGISPPTPFVFPTPNLTLTVFFNEPTAIVPPPTVTPTSAEAAGGGVSASPTAASGVTPLAASPTVSAGASPVPPTATPPPTVSYAGPGMRTGASIAAVFASTPPKIDGYLDDWSLNRYPVEQVVYGAANWTDLADLSAKLMVAWDNTALYLGVKVKDDVYAQNSHGEYIYLGDSLEVLLDKDVSGDFYLAKLSSDDYQLGISPGSPAPGKSPEAYLWFPSSVSGARTQVTIASIRTGQGYQVEVAIPWSLFGITPAQGQHYGFGFSVSDNDKAGGAVQQSMVSNVSTRVLTDPTTWGDLTLTKP